MNTTGVSNDLTKRSLDVEAVLIRVVRQVKQAEIARSMEVSESFLSEWLKDHRQTMARIIAAAGVRLVSPDKICVKREEFLLVTHIAARAILDEKISPQLLWDDAQ